MSGQTRAMRPENREDVLQMATLAFGLEREIVDRWVDRAGIDEWRVFVERGRAVATAVRVPMGMWFHERSVSNLGIAGVATDPVCRGRGIAATIMHDVLREAREAGVALSTLYPSNRALYQSVGYEVAGDHFAVSLRLNALPRSRLTGEVSRWSQSDRAEIRTLQAAAARERHGGLDRGPYLWARAEEPRMRAAQGYVFRYDGRIEAYVFLQVRSSGVFYDVLVSDWCASTARAARDLLSFFAGFNSLGDRLRYTGSSADGLTVQLPARTFEVRLEEPFMLRIVNVVQALADRGYDAAVRAELTVEIAEDSSLPENIGWYHLRVQDGRAEVAKAGGARSAIRCGIRGLAALYTGYLPARQLANIDWIDGDARSLRSAESIFGTARVCLPEMF